MAASKKKKLKPTSISRYAPADASIPAKLGGGILKELVEQDADTKELLKYSLAYINPLIHAGDNGRVLGYDNAHGFPHKHYMGRITPEPNRSWEEIRKRFEQEWREIARNFVNGDPI